MDSFLVTSLIIMLGLTLGIIISCRWYITKMAIFSDWFVRQQNRNGILDTIENSVRQNGQNNEQNHSPIYCLERDQLQTLDYNEVMNQSKDLPTYEEAIKQYQKSSQPSAIII
ncbi:hypothetical protein Bhyg_07732, partial [Pseudolycoriella hygida]